MPRPFFAVDAVLDGQARQLGVHAGAIAAVEQASWPLATTRTAVTVPGPPSDVLLIGVPRDFHYGPGMGTNPVLLTQAIAASLARARGALAEHPIVIAAALCDGWFNETEFPSYRAAYDLLQTVHHPADMLRFEEEMCTGPDWVRRYREGLRLPPLPRLLDAVLRRPHPLRHGLHRRRHRTGASPAAWAPSPPRRSRKPSRTPRPASAALPASWPSPNSPNPPTT